MAVCQGNLTIHIVVVMATLWNTFHIAVVMATLWNTFHIAIVVTTLWNTIYISVVMAKSDMANRMGAWETQCGFQADCKYQTSVTFVNAPCDPTLKEEDGFTESTDRMR